MTKIEITNDAERDLIGIYLDGVENFGLTQAERYLETLYARMSVAAEHPDFGVDYGFVREGLRRLESQSLTVTGISAGSSGDGICTAQRRQDRGSRSIVG